MKLIVVMGFAHIQLVAAFGFLTLAIKDDALWVAPGAVAVMACLAQLVVFSREKE